MRDMLLFGGIRMKEITISFFEPESKTECQSLDCEDCHRMQKTIVGEKLPICFDHAKSEAYLGMVVLA
jgi:hypothetical protein